MCRPMKLPGAMVGLRNERWMYSLEGARAVMLRPDERNCSPNSKDKSFPKGKGYATVSRSIMTVPEIFSSHEGRCDLHRIVATEGELMWIGLYAAFLLLMVTTEVWGQMSIGTRASAENSNLGRDSSRRRPPRASPPARAAGGVAPPRSRSKIIPVPLKFYPSRPAPDRTITGRRPRAGECA